MSNTTPFEELFPELPRIDRAWEARKARLMAMTPTQRVVAMRAGQLSYRELAHWSSTRPSEVPLVGTGQGGPGEFEWIAMFEASMAEHNEDATRERRNAARLTAEQTTQRRQVGRH